MSRLLRTAIVTAAGLLLAAGPAGDPARADREALRGAWTCLSMERNGKPVPEDQWKDGLLIMDGESFTFTRRGKVVSKGIRKLDPTQTPRALDDTHTTGPFKGRTYRGIYEISGDTFKTCNGGYGADRPRTFATRPGTGLLLIVYQRARSVPTGVSHAR